MQWLVLLGLSTGLRTMTAVAVLCWFAWSGLLPQTGWAFWTASLVSVVLFSLAALGEYVGDTLPQAPSRATAFPAISRFGFGALAGALGAHGVQEPVAGGVLFGLVGAAIGTFGGVRVRLWAARQVGHDLPVALAESALALLLAVWAVWNLRLAWIVDVTRLYH